MTFSAPAGGIITQSGTDTDLSGLVGNAGVTVLSTTIASFYDFGTNRLRVDGTLTISGDTAGNLESLIIGVAGATQNVDIDIGATGTLIVGSLDSQGGVEFNQAQFWSSIIEDGNTDFGDGNGNISNDGGTTDAFINVEGGGRLEWYGCINSTGGMRFKGVNDGGSTDEAQIVIRGGVLDARRLTERSSGEADQFIYNYSDELDIQSPNGDTVGFSILTNTTTGASEKGLAIIQLGTPIALQGFRPVFSSQALGGSNSAPIGLAYTVEDYTGIIGISGTDNIDLRSASSNDLNNSVITFLNTTKGSVLNIADQSPAYDSVVARQSVRGTLVDSVGANRIDAVMATQNKNSVITEDAITAGAFTLGNILLTEWDDSGPPVPTFNNPSNTDDDLWSFYVYSYLGVDRNRIDVRLRGVGGTDVDFISPTDLKITELVRATTDAYLDMRNTDRLYDRSKSFKIDNVGEPSLSVPLVSAAGTTADFGAVDLVIDALAVSPHSFSAGVLTYNPSTAPSISLVGATEAIVQGTESDEITVNFPAGIADDDVAYLVVGHPESEDNAWNTPSLWSVIIAEQQSGGTPDSVPGLTVFRKVLSGDSGSVTVTNAGVNTSGIVGQMIVYRVVDGASPEDVTTEVASGASGNPNPPSITPINAGSRILAIALGDAQQTVVGPPANYTLINDTMTPDGGTEGDSAGGISVIETVVETFSVTQQTPHVINLPTFAADDYVVVACNHSPDGTAAIGTVTTPAGWTLLHASTATGAASDSRVTSFGRVMQGGDASTLSIATSTIMTIGTVAINYAGVDVTTPIDVAAPTPNVGTGGANCPDVTTVTDGAMVVRVGIVDGTASPLTDGDEPAGHTARGFMNNNPPSNGMSLGVADEIVATAGAAGTALFGNAGTEEMVGATFVLRPAPGRSLDGCTLATADRVLGVAAAEDPGTFNFFEDEEWATATIAVRLDNTGGGGNNFDIGTNFDAVETTGTITVQNGATIDGQTFIGDVILADVVNLTDVTITGDLTIQTRGTYNFSNVTVTGDIVNTDSGVGSNVQINASNGSSLTTSEPGAGDGLVNIINTVVITITVLDSSDNSPIEGAHVILLLTSDYTTEVLNSATNASGVATTNYNYSTDQAVEGWAREADTVGTDYTPEDIKTTITANGINLAVRLDPIE